MMRKIFHVAVLAVLISGCSNGQSQSERPAKIANAPASVADVQFASAISKNQVKALQVAQFAQRNSTNEELIAFATRIKQSNESDTGKLLRIFDPGTSRKKDSSELKALSDSNVLTLWNARGTTFDKLFMRDMINHYREAITIAQTEIYSGTNESAISLAREVISNRTAAITQMLSLQKKINE